MEECTQEIMKEPGLHGVVCTDPSGALYCGHGTLHNAHSSAVVSQLANLAGALEPNSQPIAITLNSCASQQQQIPSNTISSSVGSQHAHQQQMNAPAHGASKILIKTNGVTTVAVHKSG